MGYDDPLSSYWGGRGRKFESCRSDQCKPLSVRVLAGACLLKRLVGKASGPPIGPPESTQKSFVPTLGGVGRRESTTTSKYSFPTRRCRPPGTSVFTTMSCHLPGSMPGGGGT